MTIQWCQPRKVNGKMKGKGPWENEEVVDGGGMWGLKREADDEGREERKGNL